jgi:hypothetical protein
MTVAQGQSRRTEPASAERPPSTQQRHDWPTHTPHLPTARLVGLDGGMSPMRFTGTLWRTVASTVHATPPVSLPGCTVVGRPYVPLCADTCAYGEPVA